MSLMGFAQKLQVSLVALAAAKDFGGRVNCIFQDKMGFIWIGKETGLFRYDGNELKSFRYDRNDSFSISSNNILAITEDKNGHLWIGTKGGGLNQYNPATGRFRHYLHNEQDPQSISFNEVTVIQSDALGNFWIGTDGGGLDYFNLTTGKFNSFKANTTSALGLKSNSILSIIAAKNGNYWLSTWAGGIHLFDPKHKKFTHFGEGTPFAQSNIFNVTEVRDGLLWLATYNQGLVAYDIKANRFSTVVSQKDNPIFRHLKKTADGAIWASSSQGVLHFSSPDAPYEIVPIEGQNEIKDNSCVFEDRSHLVMVGLRNGAFGIVNQTPKKFSTFPDSISFSSAQVNGIVNDRASGNLYFSAWKMLVKYNPLSKHYSTWPISDNFFVSIVDMAGADSLLCAAASGMCIFNKKKGVFTPLSLDKDWPADLLKREIWSLFALGPTDYWVGASGLAYRIGYDKQSGKWKVVTVMYLGVGERMPAAHFMATFLKDDKGNFWMGSLGGGLNQQNLATGRLFNFVHDAAKSTSISDDFIEYLSKDADGNIWAGTHAGLNRFDANLSTFRNFTVADGLSSDWIAAMAMDQKKNTWVSTQKGLASLSADLNSIKNYNLEDGLPANAFMSRSVASDNYGNLYFGSARGLVWFNPDSIKAQSFLPTPVLVDFTVNDQPIKVSEASVLPQSIELTQAIYLDNNQSAFSFKMAALSYFNPQKNQIKYKLIGYDKDWRFAGPDQMAIYAGVPSGSYEFTFMVSNEDGVWNTQVKTVKITIARPQWLSAWALLAYGVLSALGLGFLILMRNKKNRLLASKVGSGNVKRPPNHAIIQPAEVKISPAEVQFLQRAILVVEENLSDPDFNVKQLSNKLFISRPQLYRKIIGITGVTISDFIKEIRLKRAAQLIVQKPGNISEIAYQVGFNDPKYFSKCFKQQFGVSPANYTASDERILPAE